ncbi:unnamed protein product, partial [Larinioides sclopetarius]
QVSVNILGVIGSWSRVTAVPVQSNSTLLGFHLLLAEVQTNGVFIQPHLTYLMAQPRVSNCISDNFYQNWFYSFAKTNR